MSPPAGRDVRTLAALLSTLALAACGDDGSGGPGPVDPPLGDLRFEEAGLPTDAVAGHPFPVRVRLIAEAEKHHVTVLLRLVKLEGTDPAGADLAHVSHDERVWSAVIGRMEAGIPVELDETVDLPGALAPGDYAAVFELNAVDFTAEDDHLQGEEAADLANNVAVLPDPVRVTAPSAPDLQFEAVELALHDFGLPGEGGGGPDGELLSANVTIESKAAPVADAFTLEAELGIPDPDGDLRWYPLLVSAADGSDGTTGPTDRYTFRPREHVLADGSTVTAALAANREAGLHVELHATPQAHDALAGLAENTDCELRFHLDRADAIAEHDEDDNAASAWARFYPGAYDLDWFKPLAPADDDAGADTLEQGLTSGAPLAPGVAAENVASEGDWYKSYGNDNFDVWFSLDAAVSYGIPDGSPLGAGTTPVYLYDADGNGISFLTGHLVSYSTPSRLDLRALGGGAYELGIQLGSVHTVLSTCSSWFSKGPLGAVIPAMPGMSGACTRFQLVDANGGGLAQGDVIHLRAADGKYVGVWNGLLAAVYPTAGPTTALTLRVPGTSNLARHLRFSTDDRFDVTVLGHGSTPLRARAVGALDLDVPDHNLFAYEVEAFDALIAHGSVPFVTDAAGTVIVYDRQEELYSRSVSRTKRFVLGGVVPIVVEATATAQLGLHGRVTAGPTRRLTGGVGPYLDLDGTLTATVDYVVASAGVEGHLDFLHVEQLFNNSLVLEDDGTRRYEFGGALQLTTLDGEVYIFANLPVGCGTLGLEECHWREQLISWDGYSRHYDWPATVGRDL